MAIPGRSWQGVPGRLAAIDVGVGADGSVYCIGDDRRIWRWDAASGFSEVGGTAFAVSVGPDGVPWVLGDSSNALRLHGNWEDLGESFTDIGVGANGSVWACFYAEPLNYRGIWEWHEQDHRWHQHGGYGSHIAVGGDGTPWHVGGHGCIYRWESGSWVQVDGIAHDIGVGPGGEVWHIGTYDRIYYREGGINGFWVEVGGDARRIAVGPGGLPWICNHLGWVSRRL